MMVTKILLADDHQIVREGLKSLLNSHDDMEVVGEARDGRSAVQMAKDLAPDVVIMDVGMPHLNGIEATRQITSREPEAKVVALSMHADRRFMGEMLKAGAKGYLLKDGAFEELATASPLSRRVAERATARNFAARSAGRDTSIAAA